MLAWLVLRWAGIVLEVVYRPLFPWDAWSAYGMQAKVWYFQSNFEQFATGMRWFQVEGPTWTAGRSWNPPGIGLIQLWSLQALGHYDDALMNLAWPLAMAGTGLVIFGTLRMVGGSLLVAIGAVAAVLTLPVLNTQAVLAGYGDIWIGLYLLLATSGGVLAHAFGPRWLLVTGVAVAGMLMIKETSFLWTPVLALGLVAGWVRFRWILLLAVLGFLGFCTFLWVYGDPIRVSTLGRLGFGNDGFVWPAKINVDAWREIVMWPALLRHLFVYPNWHLFWFLVPGLVLASCWYALRARVFAMMAIVTWGGLTLLLGFFSFSTLGNAVLDGTSVNRLLLHLVPAIGLLGGLVVLRWQGGLIQELRI
ncbi:hypothetical protein G4Y73_08035 [Wenzhouxiangella sp. XN201]|uniref:hypothetical protein n=1 Tax=Wenzhouxiangella sp. XN201 TaxID=2710755 RepID=UPI0013C60F9D|nr:hypothetical protein [Wenzhouxiangella sp. XN201]NEZ04100.1 hypothetical protein [Wenzhouxiangella sp. XN201]